MAANRHGIKVLDASGKKYKMVPSEVVELMYTPSDLPKVLAEVHDAAVSWADDWAQRCDEREARHAKEAQWQREAAAKYAAEQEVLREQQLQRYAAEREARHAQEAEWKAAALLAYKAAEAERLQVIAANQVLALRVLEQRFAPRRRNEKAKKPSRVSQWTPIEHLGVTE